MSSTTKRGKKYYVSKNFYRYIRPGAQMVQAASDDAEVLVAAFDNDASKAFTVIAINGGTASKSVTLSGANLPAEFQAYRTSTTENCASVGPVTPTTITLPARSITSLVYGKVTEDPGSAGSGGAAGSGGVTGAGGATGSGGVAGTGGVRGTGGASTGSGGMTSSGGAGGGAGSGGSGGVVGNAKSGGCSCNLTARAQGAGPWGLSLLPLGLLLTRRRQRPAVCRREGQARSP